MVRIAGIDQELSTLELMWVQADDNERMMLATGLLVEFYKKAGQTYELKADTEDGMYIITVAKQAQEKSDE